MQRNRFRARAELIAAAQRISNLQCLSKSFGCSKPIDRLSTISATKPQPGPRWDFFYLFFGGTKLMARSAMAVIVRDGLTPMFAGTAEPAVTYMFS